MLNHIQHLDTVSDHTPQETRRALSILEPFFHTCLASNISAMCIQQLNSQVRDFLLLGCYTLFKKGDLSGRLKFISVLYAVGCYKDCEWFLNKEDDEYMKNNPSACICHFIPRNMNLVDADISEISELQMSTCVSFLPTERPIIPDVLNFELFRHIGMSSLEHNKKDHRWCWHYWAVIDSNIYYFFLKYLINSQKKKLIDLRKDAEQILELVYGPNVRHHDVSYNLLARCFCSINTYLALKCLRLSWQINQRELPFLTAANGLEHNYYKFNSAKIHFLVILYNLWFTKRPCLYGFCFQCFHSSMWELQKCSRCKTATYCSKHCQKINWTIHKAVCKIVRSYRKV